MWKINFIVMIGVPLICLPVIFAVVSHSIWVGIGLFVFAWLFAGFLIWGPIAGFPPVWWQIILFWLPMAMSERLTNWLLDD